MNQLKSISWSSLEEVETVGCGSFGTIYKAKHKEWQIHVAVKKLNGDVSQGLQELISEAKKMNHAADSPHVVRMHGILKDNTEVEQGIVMQYMEMGSLFSFLQRHKNIDWALKFRLIYETALGMNWLHNLSPPLLHLDLKTKNVLLDEDFHVKISDFGLSNYSPNCGKDVGGTLAYMPPEALSSNSGYKPDKSFDVYSFGILTSVVLTGNEPYPDARSFLIVERIPKGDRPCLEALKRVLEKTTVTYLDKAIEYTELCWHNDKNKRPPFSDCCNKWERLYSPHKAGVRRAVMSLIDQLPKTAPPDTPDTSTTASSDMTGAIQRFAHVLNITQEPSCKLNAAPVKKNPTDSYKTSNEQYSQISRYPMPQHFARPMGYGDPNQAPTYSINIHGSLNGVQIGNNNVMYVKENRQTYQNPTTRLRTPNQPRGTPTRQGTIPKATWQSQNVGHSQTVLRNEQPSNTSIAKQTTGNVPSTQICPAPATSVNNLQLSNIPCQHDKNAIVQENTESCLVRSQSKSQDPQQSQQTPPHKNTQQDKNNKFN
ncbi:receptor-interacting serine threonine- kinase 3 isoform X1 [Pelobates cultripes]|uniref:Receptor-interacting serine threonine- kinase 3 isoform X1 n=1 Tax=Pelobates cultripes TaxID=61616 RepID=A0AAD1S8B6_PELCU|nr:receptor-interacting serine threonine- kinase 3 isoform X1 [Pelobates cultripes]